MSIVQYDLNILLGSLQNIAWVVVVGFIVLALQQTKFVPKNYRKLLWAAFIIWSIATAGNSLNQFSMYLDGRQTTKDSLQQMQQMR